MLWRDHGQVLAREIRLDPHDGGIAAGLVLTLGLNRFLAQWANGNSRDPVILLAGALLLSAVSGIACAIPTWHASKVDPMTALRAD